MKKILVLGLICSCLFNQGNAQERFGLGINISSQPSWGPTGYDHVDYYYLPDIDAYYSVADRQFIYLQKKRWVSRSTLPVRYRNYNLYTGYKVVVNERKPYLHPDYYRTTYEKYKGWRGERQVVIRDSREEKYKRGRSRN